MTKSAVLALAGLCATLVSASSFVTVTYCEDDWCRIPGDENRFWTEQCLLLPPAAATNGIPAGKLSVFMYKCVAQPDGQRLLVADRYFNSTTCTGVLSERVTYPANTSASGYGFDLTSDAKRFYYAGCPAN